MTAFFVGFVIFRKKVRWIYEERLCVFLICMFISLSWLR